MDMLKKKHEKEIEVVNGRVINALNDHFKAKGIRDDMKVGDALKILAESGDVFKIHETLITPPKKQEKEKDDDEKKKKKNKNETEQNAQPNAQLELPS